MTATQRLRRRAMLLATLGALAPALAGCVSDAETTGSAYPYDYRDRHPIVLARGARILDVFIDTRSGFDERERQDVAAFVEEFRRYGTGTLTAQVPTGTAQAAGTRLALSRIKEAAGGRISVTGYRPADPAVASPIRLSFGRLQAKVGSQCGLWPQDLGVADYEFNQSNQPYWNLGCAMQSNFATQIADPVDLVRGRQQTPPDTARRMYNIDKIRSASDPTTQYKNEGGSVRSAVGQ